MIDADSILMNEQGLVFKRIINTTQTSKTFVVEWTKYNELYSLTRYERSHYETKQIEIIRNLYHTNIINVYKVFTQEKYVYLLTDYCPIDVFRLVDTRGVFSQSKFVEMSHDIVSSVRNMHSKGICHCNIKPSNILFDKYGRVQLSDFSMAKKFDNTNTSEFIEFASRDMWHLGATFYFMLTGRLITDLYFDEEEAMTKDFSMIKFPSSVSQEVVNLVLCLLSSSTKSRPTIEAVVRSSIYSQFSSESLTAMKQPSFSATNSFTKIPVIVKPVLTKLVKPVPAH